MNDGTRTTLRVLPALPAKRPPLEDYIAKAHVAWARRYQPWTLRRVA